MKGSEAIVKSLLAEKVKHIFGIQGGAIMEVYDVLYGIEASEMRHILVRHEQTAAHAAAAYARASGKVGVCMATSGPGATNLVTGITDAYCDSDPVVALTGQVATKLIGNDAFQEADIVGITMPVTKHNYQITDAKDIPRVFKEAFTIARTRRPGPVLIDLPKDVQQQDLKEFKYPEKTSIQGYKPENPKVHPMQVKRAVELLMGAERPVILAGGGVTISNASAELLELSQTLNIPVTTTLMGKGCFSENHALALGMIGMHGRKTANLMVTESDVLLAVGCRFSDRITGDVKHFAPDARIIHIDIDSAEIGKNVQAHTPIVGDAKSVLHEMIKVVGKKRAKGNTEWNRKLKQYKKEFGLDWNQECCPVKSQRVMKELDSLIDKKTIVTTEVGQCQMFAAHYLHIKEPRKFITSGGLGTMGAGFPYSIGAKMAKPDHWVVDVGSEGSFLMTCQDLATCKEEDIPVTVLLLKNKYLGMVKQWQDLFYGERRSNTFLGDTPDFVKLAEAFGAKGIRVEKASEISDALKTAKKSGETHVIDVLVDPHEHILPMVPSGGKIHEMIEKHHLEKKK
ncbi:MAG TPA: biosynthetic-type acetolactate synthase large subunit [Candidatus Altiarchaeales archaeon]|mgnify:CR=1 FL=1|nr:biosynthetic-type acetolactate synthase large subunit [Candidatus Altiarchaeales archaeon]